MLKLTRVRRSLLLPANTAGRDLLVGDLHGHRALLEAALAQASFDPTRDRVLSVGDLVNRGPDSLGTLALIEEPWFHAVLGNHELMLLGHLGCLASRQPAGKSPATGGGQWIAEAASTQRKRLLRLADRLAALPLALQVDDPVPYQVMHGDLCSTGFRPRNLRGDGTLCVQKAALATTSRDNHAAACKEAMLALRFGQHPVHISATPLGELPITYVGHSPVQQITVHNSYVYIDLGLCTRTSRGAPAGSLTLIDHQQFAGWLRGAAAARSGLAA